jgi:hypothetical protein
MRNIHARNEVKGDNNNYNADNDDTRAIDAQLVIAPQYGIVGPAPSHDPPNDSNHPNKPAGPKGPVGITKQPQYSVRKERTRSLKLHMEILRAELSHVDTGQLRVSNVVRDAMARRLTIMSEEKARRDLADLAGGKQRSRPSFYSIGARARVA